MARLDKRQLEREKRLFSYSSALERGDFTTVAAILRDAEHDPLLAGMIAEVNAVYEMELPRLTPMVKHSTNHHEEKLHMTASVNVSPSHPLTSSRPHLSVTLLAAMLAVVIIGAIMLSMRPGGSSNMQIGAQPTASATHTATPLPTATPSPVNKVNVTAFTGVINIGGTDNLLNVRAAPNATAEAIAAPPDGTTVTIIAWTPDNQWLQILLPDGRIGWVMSETVKLDASLSIPTLVPPSVIQAAPNAIILCEGMIGDVPAQLFSRPFAYGGGVMLSSIPEKTIVAILDQEYRPENTFTWYFINANVESGWLVGWVRGDVFSSVNNCPPPPNLTATMSLEELAAQREMEAQLTAMPAVMPPTSMPAATPTAYFNPLIGDGQFSAMTVRPVAVGKIAAGTRVKITAAFYNGVEWSYEIVTSDGLVASARESELAFAPDVLQPLNATATAISPWTPTPLPTLTFAPTPAALCNVINRGNDSLRLYTRPASDAAVIASLPTQISANVMRQERGSDGQVWYLISAVVEGESQITGWVRADTVTPSTACPPAS